MNVCTKCDSNLVVVEIFHAHIQLKVPFGDIVIDRNVLSCEVTAKQVMHFSFLFFNKGLASNIQRDEREF